MLIHTALLSFAISVFIHFSPHSLIHIPLIKVRAIVCVWFFQVVKVMIANKTNTPFKSTRARSAHIYSQQLCYERGNSHTVATNFCWRSAHTSATPVGPIHFLNRADWCSKPSCQQPTFVGGRCTLSDYAY